MVEKERFLSSSMKFEGRMLKLSVDTVQLPSGKSATREVVHHPGASAVVVRRDDGCILLERQYRYPLDEVIWEIPAGKLDAGEDPLACAKRELEEETGLCANDWTYLGPILTTPGFCDEVLHIYLAGQIYEGNRAWDEDEYVELFYKTPEEIKDMILKNELTDGKTLAALLMALVKLG